MNAYVVYTNLRNQARLQGENTEFFAAISSEILELIGRSLTDKDKAIRFAESLTEGGGAKAQLVASNLYTRAHRLEMLAGEKHTASRVQYRVNIMSPWEGDEERIPLEFQAVVASFRQPDYELIRRIIYIPRTDQTQSYVEHRMHTLLEQYEPQQYIRTRVGYEPQAEILVRGIIVPVMNPERAKSSSPEPTVAQPAQVPSAPETETAATTGLPTEGVAGVAEVFVPLHQQNMSTEDVIRLFTEGKLFAKSADVPETRTAIYQGSTRPDTQRQLADPFGETQAARHLESFVPQQGLARPQRNVQAPRTNKGGRPRRDLPVDAPLPPPDITHNGVPLYQLASVARRVGLSADRLSQLAKQGRIRSKQVAGNLFINIEDAQHHQATSKPGRPRR